MSFIDKLSALSPFSKKEEQLEYFFALNIGQEELTVALWVIEGHKLNILETASDKYASLDNILDVSDKLLDQVLGSRDIEVQKILFGVPNSWLIDDNLKEEYLKVLRKLVKELELSPMAYVATANALVHFLEKQEGIPPTAVLAGFEENHITTTVVRAGKLDGVKVVKRGETPGADLEKALLTFTSVETLPSKILIYDAKSDLEKLKDQLLSFAWMSKLSFLHFPKIEVLGAEIEIKSVCLAGASEINSEVKYTDQPIAKGKEKTVGILEEESKVEKKPEEHEGDNFGFVVGDVAEEGIEETNLAVDKSDLAVAGADTSLLETEDFEKEEKKKFNLKRFLPILGLIALIIIVLGLYLFLPKAAVKIFVEPKILEKDAQVIADPSQKVVDENAKIIPGQIVQTEVSGTDKDSATGKKEVGDAAKGTIVIYNKTFDAKSLSKGTIVSSPNGLKFSLDSSVNIASQSASDSGITFGKANAQATAGSIGADGNLPSGSELTISNFPSSQLSAKAEGNFSGGTSKTVTVVSTDDQKKLLAKLSSNLRLQAQQKLQDQLKNKKILQEALTEQIIRKSYSKDAGDQAAEFSLNMSASYKGTAYNDQDLRLIVSKLVTTQVPDGFQLDLSNTETQADVSNVDKNGKVIFLARFKAKLLPKINTEKVKNDIKGKSVKSAKDKIKSMENVLDAEIKISPALPSFLQRLPLLTSKITVEVGLK